MIKFALPLAMTLSVAGSVAAFTDTAVARDGCSRGYHWNGSRCVRDRAGPRVHLEGPGGVGITIGPKHRSRRHVCPPHWDWNPRMGRCTSNYR